MKPEYGKSGFENENCLLVREEGEEGEGGEEGEEGKGGEEGKYQG